MVIEIFPDNAIMGMSPRISFSHDLSQSDDVPIEQYISSSTSSSSIDFDFCVFRENFDHESSSADELFFDGKILPIEIKKRLPPPRKPAEPQPSRLPPLPAPPLMPRMPMPEQEQKQSTASNKSSFWKFKRSASLNCGSGYAGSLCPLPLLSRSNSIGSTSSRKRTSLWNNQKQNFLKQSFPNCFLKQTQSSSSSSRPPLKKSSNHASYGNGVKVSPVLMVPPASLFGWGSFFSGGRDKIRARKK